MSGHVRDDISALLDDALTPPERARVEAHLAACPACAAEKARLSLALSLLRRLPPPPPPGPGFEQRFYARLAREGERRTGLLRAPWRLAVPLAVAGAAAALMVTIAVRHRGPQTSLREQLELFENYEAVASLGDVEGDLDVEVVAHLHETGGRP